MSSRFGNDGKNIDQLSFSEFSSTVIESNI